MSTSKPVNRTEFKEFCLRKLGKPVINIDVTDDQVNDALEEALSFFIDYHYDGTTRTYLKHQLTATDITNKYITVPESIIGVHNIFPIGSSISSSNDMFSLDYQIRLNTVHNLSSFQMAPYYSTMMKYNMMNELFVGVTPIRYNRHNDKVYIDVASSKLIEGDYIVLDCFTAIDPDVDTDIWNDRILQKHCTALIKRTWGQSLSKFEGVQLPGGMTMNGREIYNDAITEIQAIEDEYNDNYRLPPEDIIL